MTRRRLVILAGAHKTASSHVQHSLLGSEAALRHLGIAVIGPKTLRQDLTPFSQLLRDGMTPQVVRAGADGFLSHYGGQASTVVLMDENILGGTDRKMLMRKSRLYPWAPRRVARLLELFEGHEIELAISVRNPATFLPSCWSESLHHGRYDDFNTFIQGFDPTGKVWSGLIDRITQTAPNIRLTLWRYEDLSALGPSLYAQLLQPEAADTVHPDPEVRRAGLSQHAADWFQAQTTRDKTTVQEARKLFPKIGPETAFVPWTDDELTALTRSYDRDIRRLTERSGITVLRP
ncbi:MAG: hypothetical protein AAFY25_05770 [Pseudomonadota bacterium]